MINSSFSIDHLQLILPPTASTQRIDYTRGCGQDKKEKQNVKIHITAVYPFCFSFSFVNCRKNASLVASIVCDDPSRSVQLWQPPRWHVLTSRGVPQTYEIKAVSWDEHYQKRFESQQKRIDLQRSLYSSPGKQIEMLG